MNKFIIKFYKAINLIKRRGISEFILRVLEKMLYSRKINNQLEIYKNSKETLIYNNKKNRYPKISIVVPVYKTNIIFLREMVESVKKQTYENWELCIFNGGSKDNNITMLMNEFSLNDNRIKYLECEYNYGISGNTNKALDLATGEYIGLLDHDDILEYSALHECTKVINEFNADLIYTDEDKITSDGINNLEEHIKSKWAPSTLMSYNYICHFLIFKTLLLKEIGGFDTKFDGSQDYEFIMRLSSKAHKIYHIPKILYHWRISPESTALNINVKNYALNSGKLALECILNKRNLNYEVIKGRFNGSNLYVNNLKENTKITIAIIGTWVSAEEILSTLKYFKQKTSYNNYSFIVCNKNQMEKLYINNIIILHCNKKNYSQIINEILKVTETEINIILDYKVKILDLNWCGKLVAQAQEDDINIIAGKILRKGNFIYSNGISVTNKDIIENYRNCYSKFYGYMGKNTIIHNVTAINSKLYLIKKSTIKIIGYFDEKYDSDIALIDYCMRLNLNNKYIKTIPDEICRYLGKDKKINKCEKEKLLKNYKNILKEYDLYNPIKYN